MAITPYSGQPQTQPGPYDISRQPVGGGYGGPSAEFGINNPGRDRVALAMMQVQQPPGGLSSPGLPGMPPGIGGGGMPPAPMPPPGGGVQPAPPGAAPMQPGINLPGTMQPGQLPPNMNPQGAIGSPALPMPPR